MSDGLIHQSWFWLDLALVVVTVSLVILILRLFPSLSTTVVKHHKKPGEKLVTLLGDSITEGKVGESYVHLLEGRMDREGFSFMNAGLSADTAFNLLNRLDPVLDSEPDYIVILIGTNDMEAYLRGGYLPAFLQWVKRLPQPMTLDWFTSLLRQLVQSVQGRSSAKVAICSIPILGEDLDSRPNQNVRMFNRSIKALTDELQIAYLPVYEKMEDFLRSHQQQAGLRFDEASSGKIMFRAVWDHNILGRSWDDISTDNHLLLTVDTEHFNRRGASIIADLIEGWVYQNEATKTKLSTP